MSRIAQTNQSRPTAAPKNRRGPVADATRKPADEGMDSDTDLDEDDDEDDGPELRIDPLADVAWTYLDPIPECPRVKGLVAFFNEKVDLIIDGERVTRPQTPWS